ncbi:MAG: carbohydrate kinase [Myxococcota bacterium]|nr:carbohydrate kinase [Myxococcota bacterium]
MTGLTEFPQTGRVLVIGEAILDFLPTSRGALSDQVAWHVHSGGAPANVAIGLALHGVPVQLASVLGADPFGTQLKAMVEAAGVDCDHVRRLDEEPTGLCFVTLDADGERTFTHRGGHPFKTFSPDDLDGLALGEIEVLHFGCGALRNQMTTDAVEKLIDTSDAMVTCDPGFFPRSWGDRRAVQDRLIQMMCKSQIFKCAIGDVRELLNITTPDAAVDKICAYGAQLVVVTHGHHGAWWGLGSKRGHVPAPQVELIDSTGAGDAFMAGLIRALPTGDRRAQMFDHREVAHSIMQASQQGARAVTQLGATTAERAYAHGLEGTSP